MRGNEYLTSNANTAWPFDADSPNLDRRFAALFADGGVMLYTGEIGCEVVVTDASLEDGELSFIVEKRRDTEVIDRCSLSVTPGNGEYTVAKQPWCFFILDNHEILSSEGDFDPDALFSLDPSAIDVVADKITSFSLYNHHEEVLVGDVRYVVERDVNTPTVVGIDGKVRLVEGTNIALSTKASPEIGAAANLFFALGATQSLPENAVMISASPGLGTGKAPCLNPPKCDDDGRGNITPDADGNVVIEADDCYQVSPQGGQTKVVRIAGRCTACCQCDNYVETGNRLGSQATRVVKARDSLFSTASKYNAAADAYNRKHSKKKKEAE